MAKIFDVQSELHENPNRNNFDLHYKNHLTGKFGVIYPFMCKPVVPTDTWEIDTAIGVNLMPMWYPTQSNMRFIVHYFYVPNRIIWKDWKNTIQGLEDHTFPYLDRPTTDIAQGKLADYLGVPTNLVLPSDTKLDWLTEERSVGSVPVYSGSSTPSDLGYKGQTFADLFNRVDAGSVNLVAAKSRFGVVGVYPLLPLKKSETGTTLFSIDKPLVLTSSTSHEVKIKLIFFGSDDLNYLYSANFNDFKSKLVYVDQIILATHTVSTTAANYTAFVLDDTQIAAFNAAVGSMKFVYAALVVEHALSTGQVAVFTSGNGITKFDYQIAKGTSIEISNYPLASPYYATGNTTNTVKISSLPFRVYEMCYNSYYRNQTGNQPFVIDGVTQYNKYLTTDDSGADSTAYELKSRNWELDAYTSCLPSPQQGDAPLVGVTIDGNLTVQHDDGRVSTARLRDLDGAAGVELLSTSVDPEHPEDARAIVNLATSGMTIADFRAGNALTRFLETSLRTGFRYADFIFGHFGKSPSHQELDMPIFLGGYTQIVDVNKVSNVSASGDVPLGEFAGAAASFGGAQHKIKHYFDDFGYVIGLMMLVPDAAYSQVLPKHFTYSNRLDYFFPEFSQLSLQPITYEELCPIQSYFEYRSGQSTKLLTDTFGYQRPNHDLVWSPDEVHGLFRGSLRGSVINRRFGLRPELGDDFLKIKPEECNDIFSVTEENDDVWIGQVVVDIKAQRPIPRVVVPSLGR